MEDTRTSTFQTLPTSSPPPSPNRSRCKGRCLRCKKLHKGCDRIKDEDCQLCQRAGVQCSRSLTCREAHALKAQPPPWLMLGAGKEALNIGGTPSHPYQRDSVESGVSTEGGPFDRRQSLEDMDMFDRKHLRDDLNIWFTKMNGLVLFELNLRDTLVSLFPQPSRSSVPLTSQGFALQEVTKELEWTIEELAKFAGIAVKNANSDLADRIYLNIWDGLQSTTCISTSLRYAALSKMAQFYHEAGNEPRSQRTLRTLSSLATNSPEIEDTEINPHRMLGHSLLRTSKSIHTSFIKNGTSNIGAVIRSPALNQSIRSGNPEVFQATLDAVDNQAAHLAAQVVHGHWRTFDSAGSDEHVNTRDTLGRSPLFLAAALGREDFCMALLDAGARIDDQESELGRSILTMATRRGLVNLTKCILSLRNKEVNPVNLTFTSTPLQEAAAAGHGEIVSMLLDHEADPRTERIWDGKKRAADLARENGFEGIAKDLERATALARGEFLPEGDFSLPDFMAEEH